MVVVSAFFAGGISAWCISLLYWFIGIFVDTKDINNTVVTGLIFGAILLILSAIIYLIVRHMSKNKN